MTATYTVDTDGGQSKVTILADGDGRIRVRVDSLDLDLAVVELPDGRTVLTDGTRRLALRHFRERDQRVVVHGHRAHRFRIQDARAGWLRGAGGRGGMGSGRILASMPGRVVRVPVQVGDVVPPNGVVAVLEAMKMENDVRSPAGGRVVQVAVQEGVAVEAGALLVQLEAAS